MSHEQRIASATGLEVVELRPLGGGACQDNFSLRVREGEGERRFALRSDAAMSLPGSITRQQEFPVIQAAVAAGVPTPAVRDLHQGLIREGAWSYLMDWVEGEAIGSRVLKRPELAGARAALPEQLAQALTAVHSVSPATVELPPPPRSPSAISTSCWTAWDRPGPSWSWRCTGRGRTGPR
jgi:aminoglycoside phosphotransferase (APT) family kinase protein